MAKHLRMERRRRKMGKKESPPALQRALPACWPGCVLPLLLHFEQSSSSLKGLPSVAAVCWLHSSPFPLPQHKAPTALQPRCFPCVPALPLRWLCLACVNTSRRAETVCCSVGTALVLLRPSGAGVVSVIMDNKLGRECWLDLPERRQLTALPGPSQGAAELLPCQA